MPSSGATPKARLLDLTRLVSRVGRGPFTGIDRVEMAYLEALLQRPEPAFGLVRGATGRLHGLLAGHLLLGRAGLAGLRDRLAGRAGWGRPDWVARLHLRQQSSRRRALSDLRRMALAQATTPALGKMLRQHLPAGVLYLNVGHSNLAADTFAAVREVPDARIEAFVHDTIPLDFPEFTRQGEPENFARKLRMIGARADRVIYNSQVSRDAAETHFARWGRVPPGLVVHLGGTPARPDPAALAAVRPAALRPGRPYLVVLGTIEPRKNHAFLLDLWEGMASRLEAGKMPALCIAGARGWCSAALFARLDASPLTGRHVFELPGLGDGAVAALLQGACGLLFPSHVEGFGLPALEAAALEVPVLCNDLPVFHETLGDYPVYVPTTDDYQWQRQILALAGGQVPVSGGGRPAIPTWDEHFAGVFGAAGRCRDNSVGRAV
ncbi:glycosyltransferase family 4 protein [Alkalilacustris brevis]|uniref:glycosyltransferase family 4 protein n=1 Tax=Alkalilacustris brevis TaxID=2026338 RepID=UPI000E0D2400|nr:glycosyltransferase family 1 protein [Alkalilacustris brevis]